MFDSKQLIKDFPILAREINGQKLVYLDNAATSQKPKAVIDSICRYYEHYNANVHRGIHTMSEEATAAYEEVREKVGALIGSNDTGEVIYTSGTTDSINLVAYSWGRQNVLPGDEIVLTPMEHHSNLVPWQQLAAEREAKLVFLDLTEDGEVCMDSARKLIGPKTRLVAITQMSNVLGTIVPVREIADLAHSFGAIVLVDGAQGVPHLPTSVQELGCDFLAFSLHKMLGPTGVGVLWGKRALLEAIPPFKFGGDMISSVAREKSRFNELPWKFEAGTPNVEGVIASGAAIDYLTNLGMAAVREHELEISDYALKKLGAVKDIVIYGPKEASRRGGVISFNIDGIHPHDLGQILSDSAIAIRAGHHCCQPLMKDLKVMGTARASFYIYNTKSEVDVLVAALEEAEKVLGHVAFR